MDLQFAAQAAELDVDGAIEDIGVLAADLFHQGIARQDPPRIVEECGQQREFPRGQQHHHARRRAQLPARHVELESGEVIDHPGLLAHRRRIAPTQDSADPRQQLARAHRLGHIVVGAEFEPDHAIDLLAHRAHDNDRRSRRRGDTATDRQAVLARQHEVQHDQIDGRGGQDAVGLLGVGGDVRYEPVARQVFGDLSAQARVVLDHEDMRRRLGLRCYSLAHGPSFNSESSRHHFP